MLVSAHFCSFLLISAHFCSLLLISAQICSLLLISAHVSNVLLSKRVFFYSTLFKSRFENHLPTPTFFDEKSVCCVTSARIFVSSTSPCANEKTLWNVHDISRFIIYNLKIQLYRSMTQTPTFSIWNWHNWINLLHLDLRLFLTITLLSLRWGYTSRVLSYILSFFKK